MSSNNNSKPPASVIFIFGGSGDLNQRKLIPALYNLFIDGWMPEKFAIVGMGRTQQSDDQFRGLLLDDINKFSRSGKADDKKWKSFSDCVHFQVSEIGEDKTYKEQADTIK